MPAIPRFTVPILLASLAILTVAIRWGMIERYSSPVPFHDQWIAEGESLIEPWACGELALGNFTAPSNDHRPILTRALAFAEFRFTGSWDARFEMAVNSLFYALIPVVLSLIAGTLFGIRGWLASTAVLAVLFALPANYENALWGFQSQFFLMVLLAIVYLGGTFSTDRTGPRWIAAQAAGALGLLSMAGGIIAPMAAVGIALVRLIRRRDTHAVTTLATGLALAAAGWWLLVPSGSSDETLRSQSIAVFVEALMSLLSWPLPAPVLALLVHAPWMLVAARTLVARDAPWGHIVVAAIGGWVVLQAAAFAYARGAMAGGIPPRYFDVLIVGIAVNAACLALLMCRCGRLQRLSNSLLTGAWLVAVAAGLWQANTPERLNPILLGNAGLQERTLFAVRDYIHTGDPATLSRDPHVAHHFPSVENMQRLLDNPRLRASLPAEIRGGAPAVSGKFVQFALRLWPWILVASGLVFVCVGSLAFARGHTAPAPPEPEADVPWLALGALFAGVAIALIAVGLRPWEGGPEAIVRRSLEAAGTAPDGFAVPDALGQVSAEPGTPTDLLFGTYIDGDHFTGDVRSSEFSIENGHLIIPVIGYPTGSGNSLRLEVLGADGSVTSVVAYDGANPGERVRVWAPSVSPAPGLSARLVMSDHSKDFRGWMGIGTPRLTDDARSLRRLEIALDSGPAKNARRLPVVLFAAAVVLTGIGIFTRFRARTVQ